MKSIHSLLLICLAMLASQASNAQEFRDVLKKTIQFEKISEQNVLYISNINGDVTVEGYSGNDILIEVSRQITAKTKERLEQGKSEVGIGVIDRYDTLIMYMTGGCENENFKWINGVREDDNNWNYNFNNCNPPYDFLFDITVKVPHQLNLYASTINKGDVLVEGVHGSLSLENINGDITAKGIHGNTRVNAINGDVELRFVQIPESGHFYSLNGDINAYVPKGFKASVTFESFNGDFFTNINEVEQEPVFIKTASDEPGTKFKAETKSAISFRGGGVPMDFETFNGDVYLKEAK